MNQQELHDRKGDIVARKVQIMADLSAIKNKTASRMPRDDFKTLCTKRTKLVQELAELEAEVAGINRQLRHLADEDHKQRVEQEKQPENQPDIVRELVTLRQKYQEFSQDLTRVSSMRKMAADFVGDLNAVIKNAVNPKKD